MTWFEFNEKINYWAVSTAVSKISSLEDMGAPDEIVDALIVIGFEDKKGATRLLNRALETGVKFSGENLVEIRDMCDEESFLKALYQSADAFTAGDLEDLYGCIDDKLIVEVVKRYKLPAPANLADEYAEELGADITTPISWSRFFESYEGWNPEYARARLKAVENFGSSDEVLEVMEVLYRNDRYGASALAVRAMNAGVCFQFDDIYDLVALCNKDTVDRAVYLLRHILTEESLEELYGNVSDDLIIQIARECNLRLPEDLQEESDEDVKAAEQEELQYSIQCAIEAANYALECLAQAQISMDNSRSASLLDMMTGGFITSAIKYSELSEADADIQQAQHALDSLNGELQLLNNDNRIRLKYGQLATVIDMWLDVGFLDVLTDIEISKAQKRIARAIKQVENVRRELMRAF